MLVAAAAAAARDGPDPPAAYGLPDQVPRPPAATTQSDGGPVQLELRDAEVRFEGRVALTDISLSVRAGERVAVVGANGSGKTTLLRALHGLVPLSRGQRHCATDGDGRPLRQAMVFQRPVMLRMSCRAQLTLALWLGGIPRGQRVERIARALARVGLQARARQNARALSGGQQQRLALARAWVLTPQILFLDEPTANLDPTAKREVEILIEDFAAEGLTLVMSSHNLGQVKRLASRVLYLEEGRLLADSDTERFFNGHLPREAELFLKGELPWG
ncbi:MAG: ATP-binding cassette domain-containing protein [Burkholderiaceae bacterium]